LITDIREYYKPFEYPEAYELAQQQMKVHWLKEDINMSSDLVDWNSKLTDIEKNLIGNILKGFTQMEVLVGGYWRKVANWFPKPEICQMATAMSYFEGIHQDSYDMLNSTLGLNDYSGFIHEKEISEKIDYLTHTSSDFSDYSKLHSLAVFSAFTEGVSIFSSFAILLSFQTRNLLKGVGNIITLSVRDESHHSKAGIWLFKQYKKELQDDYSDIDWKELERSIRVAAHLVAELEFKYIDKCFELGGISCRNEVTKTDFVLTKEHIKTFIKSRINQKMQELGYENLYDLNGQIYRLYLNDMKWFDNLSHGTEFQDFFASRPTEYSKYNIGNDLKLF